jgi:hypothetical protein
MEDENNIVEVIDVLPHVPEEIRPDMSLEGRSGAVHVETTAEIKGKTYVSSVVTLSNGTAFAVDLTGVPEQDIDKVIEDEIVKMEIRHHDPVINLKANKNPTQAEEI